MALQALPQQLQKETKALQKAMHIASGLYLQTETP